MTSRVRTYTITCWTLSALFAGRVLGQAVQRWVPQPFLPPAAAFQGSDLPYWLLLAVQLVILLVMASVSWRIQKNFMVPKPRTGRVLAWAGGVYMALALGRIAVGLTVADAPTWFTTWISAVFHLVLASFVIVVSLYHLRRPAPGREGQ